MRALEKRVGFGLIVLATLFVFWAGVMDCARHVGDRPVLWIIGGIALTIFWVAYLERHHDRAVKALRELDQEWRECVSDLLEGKEGS